MFPQNKLLKLSVLKNTRAYCQSNADPIKLYSNIFFDKKVQTLLKKISSSSLEKTFKPKYEGRTLAPMNYVLMTPEQYEKSLLEVKKKLNWLLAPPPFIKPRNDEVELLQSNESIDGHDIHHSKFIFTDISDGFFNEIRTIIVRDPNGNLRRAFRGERHRMNQIYFPLPGRSYEMPEMFQEELLKDLLEREEYEFVLDKACAQFDPDDPMYHKVLKLTFEKINDNYHFEKLHSTRHFGSLAYFLICHKNIDNMLFDIIRLERITDAFDLVKLYHIIHPDCKSATNSSENTDLVQSFIEFDSNKNNELELLYNNFKSKQIEKEETKQQLEEAHGL